MTYFISFLEGIITFISPCLLPMLPVYIVYFAGGKEQNTKKTVRNALGFVLGFSLVFVTLGAFAAAIGSFLHRYQTVVNIVSGVIVIIFGLNFTGLLKLGFLNSSHRIDSSVKPLGFVSSLIFGIIFAVGWTPCVGAFLGSALLLASQQASLVKGVVMLLCYSLGLGIPFVLSALLIDKLKGAFDFIKKHYAVINIVCGVLLVIVGLLMATGKMNALLGSLA